MSARHDDPLRDYRTRADFLRKDLRSGDPDVARAAADRVASLPQYASALRDGSFRPEHVCRQDLLDVIAAESGWRGGWRHLKESLFFLFPIDSPEWRRGSRTAHEREEQRLHDELLERALDKMYSGWEDVRSNLSYQPWEDCELPCPKVVIGEGGEGCVPDATGIRDGVLHIVEVMRAEEFKGKQAATRLRVFAEHARALGARFQIFVDGWGAYDAPTYVAEHGIDAEVVVWDGMYRHEIEDALAADWWRDTE